MKIIFFKKSTLEELTKTDHQFFVMNNEVYWRMDPLSPSESFNDFIIQRPDIGWRVTEE
jgi:hypothetical protein